MKPPSLDGLPDESRVAQSKSICIDWLTALPHRVLFQNKFLRLVLADFKRGQILSFSPHSSLLVTIAHGHVQFVRGNTFTLSEGAHQRLEAGDLWTMHALSEADLLFFIPHYSY